MAVNVKDTRFKKHFEDFVNMTDTSRQEAEKRRDYRDLKQWTDEEKQKITARGQAPVVFDQFSQKVDALIGLEVSRRTDPRAYPVHPKHEKASEVITDGLRYVESRTDFDEASTEVFEDVLVEGYGGAIVEAEEVKRRGKKEWVISVKRIPWDRLYYDPHCIEKDFSDSTYFGITIWMDLSEAQQMWPKSKGDLADYVKSDSSTDETFEDRPKDWKDSDRDRLRVNQEYFKDKGVWQEVFYSGDLILQEPKDSPYLDDDDSPMCPIEMESHFIDRNNVRYGYMQRLMDVQDEINHRRSKALFMLSSVSVLADKGAFGDGERSKILGELRKGQSFIEKMPGSEVSIDRNVELGQGQLAFYQDAQQAMDSVGVNPELSGRTDQAISGKAFIARQQSGMAELNRVMSLHSSWKRREYRQIWLRMRQFWQEEKWIRVTDEENAMRFVGLNVPVSRAEKLLEQQSGRDINKLREINKEAVDQFIQQEIQQDPTMGEIVEKRNDVKELEMDIIIEEAPETVTLQQEQFETLANLSAARADPMMFEALIMASSLKNKEEILEKFRGDPEQARQQQQAQAEKEEQLNQILMAQKQVEIEGLQANNQKLVADTQKVLSEIPLNEAKAKDELASAIERVGKTSALPLQ